MNLTLDIESRSQVDLRKVGAYKYAQSPTTEFMCVAFKIDDSPTRIWFNPVFEEFIFTTDLPLATREQLCDAINNADTIEAHNANFERPMFEYCGAPKYGFPELPVEKLRCSMAKAMYLSLPGKLETVCEVMNTRVKKDSVGHRQMLLMSQPRKPRKNEDPLELLWYEDCERLQTLGEYCITDVDCEHELSVMLPDLPEDEQKLWVLDSEINRRGIPIDIGTVRAFIDIMEKYERELIAEIGKVTGGLLHSPRQRDATLKYLRNLGVPMPSLDANAVDEALGMSGIDPRARRVLEIRQLLAKGSTKKLQTMLNCTCDDGRIRGAFQYYAASTGRWGGRLIQPQNLPRPRKGVKEEDIEEMIELIKAGDLTTLEAKHGSLLECVADCVRAMIYSESGFKCSDFSSIEGHVLAWLADEELASYEETAASIFHVSVDQVTSDQRQVGKVATLSLGFQGGVGAFQQMASSYGVEVSDKQADEIKTKWRESRPETVKLWYDMENSALEAMANPGRKIAAAHGQVYFEKHSYTLTMTLPSGRRLFYFNPVLKKKKTPWGEDKEQIHYRGMDSKTHQWWEQHTYGGKLTENAVQAIARDLLVIAMREAEKAGMPVVLHVHDELACEQGSLKKLEKIMSTCNPPWCARLPLGSSGWEGKRYQK